MMRLHEPARSNGPRQETSGRGILRPADCRTALMFGHKAASHIEVDSESPLLRRFAAAQPSEGDEIIIGGLAVPFNTISSKIPGAGIRQVFLPYAFNASLTNDLRVLFNDLDHVLGRTSAGTGRVWADSEGLHFECVCPRVSWADDLLVSMERADVTGAGAWCDVVKSHYEVQAGERLEVIEAADLRAVAVVSFQVFDAAEAEVSVNSAIGIAAGMLYTPSPHTERI